jgi:eukaryotic-like serine/threonine-protein kinase
MIRVGPFQLTSPIGRGGMGRVWAGLHVEHGVNVAVKVLTARRAINPDFRRAFFREAQAMAGLNHPNIATIFDYGEISVEAADASNGRLVAGTPYLAMELANKGTLGTVRGGIGWNTLKVYLLSLLDALAHAHARGILHKDLKPANILVGRRNAVKLTDFGLAHAVASEEQSTDTPFQNLGGTPAYMAPEQFDGDNRTLGPWTDMYSFGCLAWSMVTGEPPYGRKNWVAVANGHLRGRLKKLEPTFPVPNHLEEWLRQLMQRQPELRFQRAADAAWALLQLRDPSGWEGLDQSSSNMAALETIQRPSRAQSGNPAERTTLIWGEVETLIRLPSLKGPHAASQQAENPYPLPPMPLSWTAPSAGATTAQLMGTGLTLYSLRDVGLVGRNQERDGLWAALRDVRREGTASVVVLSGPTGVGKSRLAQWVCERAEEMGAAVTLRAQHGDSASRRDGLPAMLARHLRCFGYPRSEVAAYIRELLEKRPGSDLNSWAALTAFCSPASKAERWPGSSPLLTSPKERMALLTGEVARMCSQRPTVIWLDDVQWGREALDWVHHLLSSQATEPLPVLVVMTVRDDLLAERSVEAETLAALLARDRVERIEIGPLPSQQMRKFINQLIALDESLVNQVEDRTAGNPMFARHLIGDWVARDVLAYGHDGFRLKPDVELSLPDDLHAAWSATVNRLLAHRPPNDGICLEIAATLGTDVDSDEWRAVCKRTDFYPSAGLVERMVAHRLARTTLGLRYGWSFTHSMLRECFVRRAAESGRLKQHHLEAAGHLAELKDDKDYSERRARHLLAGDHAAAAVDLLLECARAELKQGDHRAAFSLLTERDQALDQLSLPKNDARLGEGWASWAHLCRMRRKFDAAERWALKAERQATSLGADHTLYLALREQGLLANIRGKPEEAMSFLKLALGVAEGSANAVGAAWAVSKLGWVKLQQGHRDEARRLLHLAVTRYEACHKIEEAGSAYLGLYEAARKAEDFETAEKWLVMAKKAWEKQGSQWGLVTVINNAADIARLQGRLDEAEAGFRRAVLRFKQLGLEGTSVARVNLALVLIAREEFGEARVELEDFLGLLSPARRSMEALIHCCLLPCAANAHDWASWDYHFQQALLQLDTTGYVDVDIAEMLELAAGMALESHEADRAAPVLSACQEQWRRLGRRDRAETLSRLS